MFIIYLLFSKYSQIRLGGDYAKPEYSYFAWISMLFSAGMGIGILFYGVAEPLIHYMNPPKLTVDETVSITAMKFTFLNWGLHAWTVYIIVALCLAYVGYRRELPLSIRFTFYPLLKDKVYGWWGHIIDIFAVISTLFGVATSLGLGVIQVNTGLNYLFGVEDSLPIKLFLIMFITSLATFSVASGIKRGVKWFSIVNLSLAFLMMLVVFILGPTYYIFKSFFINSAYYIKDFVEMSLFDTFTLSPDWLNIWTLFYWAWWISWSPYVGMFIAKISKGRTIKEFIIGVLFVPTALSFLWLTVFGNAGIYLMENVNPGIGEEVTSNISTSLFVLFESYPLADLLKGFAVILVIIFFVTSSDSGSYVIDMITSGGKQNSSRSQKMFWSLLQGITACVLLIGGGLIAMQTAVITMAIPFSIILLFMCISFYKGLMTEDYSAYALKKENLDDLKVKK